MHGPQRTHPWITVVSIVHLRPGEADADALKRLVSDLQRYAGWLAKDHASVSVRAGVQALGVAIDRGSEALPVLQSLDNDLGRLPSGGIRKMLRQALEEIRAVLEPTGIDEEKGDRS